MDPKCLLTSTDLQTRRARCQHQLSFLFYYVKSLRMPRRASSQWGFHSRKFFIPVFPGMKEPDSRRKRGFEKSRKTVMWQYISRP